MREILLGEEKLSRKDLLILFSKERQKIHSPSLALVVVVSDYDAWAPEPSADQPGNEAKTKEGRAKGISVKRNWAPGELHSL